jgi:hypothetical protein
MRRSRLLLAVATAALALPATAAARTSMEAPPFRVLIVDHLSARELRSLAARGAVGLLVPGVGPTTNRRRALAALERGSELDAYLGGVPSGPRLLAASDAAAAPGGSGLIVLSLPPAGAPRPNDRRYPIAVVGGGFHGLLRSPTTRIDGLVSIVDVAPTVLGRQHGALTSVAGHDAVARLAVLDHQVHANNRLKLAALIIVACTLSLLAAVRPRAAIPSVLAALLSSIIAGAGHITSEPLIVAVLVVGMLGGGLALERICRDDGRLLAAIVAVLLVHVVLLVVRPDWVALTPLGPTQNSRFWGIGNQLETLLLAPLLVGAVLARRLYGTVGFGAFALFVLALVTDNRLGSDAGGAIVFGVALAFVGARLLRIGVRGFATLLLLAATVVLTLVSLNLRAPGPDHLRSAFADGLPSLLAVIRNRVPLAYLPALHHWPLVLPLAVWFAFAFAVVLRISDRQARQMVLASGLAVAVSLLVNDSAAYELTGGVAVLAAVGRFSPAADPIVVHVPAPVAMSAQAIPSENRQSGGGF